MKQYKLIKGYPGSPEVGQEFFKTPDGGYLRVDKCVELKNWIIPADIENYPEFWELQEEKTFEILSLLCSNHNRPYTLKDNGLYSLEGSKGHAPLKFLLEGGTFDIIHSIKRLSDGEIFTLGDMLQYNVNIHPISGFKIAPDFSGGLKVEFNCTQATAITHTFKFKQRVIFTTEDGVDVSDVKQKLTWVRLCDMKYGEQPFVHDGLNFHDEFKYFSTEKAAIDFINSKKVLFTTEDCVDIYEGDSWFYVAEGHTDVRKTCTLVYAGTNKKCVTRFSTEEAAKEFIRKNTPILKTSDGVKIFEGDTYYFVPIIDSTGYHPYFSLQSSVAEKDKDYPGGNKAKDFSTKELAEEFIIMNKPYFSINDIAMVYTTANFSRIYQGEKKLSKQFEALRRMANKKIKNNE